MCLKRSDQILQYIYAPHLNCNLIFAYSLQEDSYGVWEDYRRDDWWVLIAKYDFIFSWGFSICVFCEHCQALLVLFICAFLLLHCYKWTGTTLTQSRHTNTHIQYVFVTFSFNLQTNLSCLWTQTPVSYKHKPSYLLLYSTWPQKT